MVRIGVVGASGALGTLVRDVVAAADDLVLGAAVVSASSRRLGQDAGGVPFAAAEAGGLAGCDVVIDVSTPEGLLAALPHLAGVPLVSGTTGLEAAQQARVASHAASAPLLQASNFSTGVHVLLALVERAARALPDADLEIVELHHRRKVDAPSGTALALGAAAERGRGALEPRHGRGGQVGPRARGELGYHAVRGGDVVGDHTVWLLADGERVALQHIASSRATFAHGAVRAARWLVGQPAGTWSMADVLGL